MVLQNEVLDGLRQFRLFGEFHTVGDVAYHYRGALLGCEQGVRIDATLVFGKEIGALDFADVVIDGTHTHQLHVGTYAVSSLGCDVRHLHNVLESAGARFGELSEQRLIEVGEFDERER